MQVDGVVQLDGEFGMRIMVEVDLDLGVAIDLNCADLAGIGEGVAANEVEPLIARAIRVGIELAQIELIALAGREIENRSWWSLMRQLSSMPFNSSPSATRSRSKKFGQTMLTGENSRAGRGTGRRDRSCKVRRR